MTADVTIAGAGPSGPTAALVLARAERNMLVLDAGNGRNASAAHAHNVFAREGTSPSDLRGIVVREDRLSALDVMGRQVRAVVFASGERMDVGAVYVSPALARVIAQSPQSGLHRRGSSPCG